MPTLPVPSLPWALTSSSRTALRFSLANVKYADAPPGMLPSLPSGSPSLRKPGCLSPPKIMARSHSRPTFPRQVFHFSRKSFVSICLIASSFGRSRSIPPPSQQGGGTVLSYPPSCRFPGKSGGLRFDYDRGGVEKIHFPKGKRIQGKGDNRERRERERLRPSSPPWVRRELRDNGGLAGARLYLLPREDP